MDPLSEGFASNTVSGSNRKAVLRQRGSRRKVEWKKEKKLLREEEREFLAGSSIRTAVSLSQPLGGVYHTPTACLCHSSLSPHVTFNMAPLPNCPRREHTSPRLPSYYSPCSSPQSIIQVTLVCISGYVLARRGILDKSTQRVVTFISPHVPLTDSSLH